MALRVDHQVFVSQHIGDLETAQAYSAFCQIAADLPRLYDANPEVIACDLHPDYLSTKYALGLGDVQQVQHHWAHVVSCMAENELEPPALGVAWDGTGYGVDGTVWGGEFLCAQEASFTRVAHLRQFRLPGGDASIRQPRRSRLGLLFEIFGDEIWNRPDLLSDFSPEELLLLKQMLAKKLNAPLTSSAGRLFDAVASLIHLRQHASFEGQAAMDLEFALQPGVPEAYSFVLGHGTPIVIDWENAILEIIADLKRGEPAGVISARFHNMLTAMIVAVARRVGERKIVLTGGCFQNRSLVEGTINRLLEANFQPYWHQRVPPNDGGISLGQVIAAGWARSLNIRNPR